MAGVLYIVATPIGNLDDISLRAIATLEAVDLIAAEDTRHSRQLLRHLGVGTRLVSCHQHNESRRSQELLRQLEAGRDIALISDAGTPLISDPGYRLVHAARARGIRVSPIPGASSVIAALSAAGLPTDRFLFCGFLSSKSAERDRQLQRLSREPATLVLFEASHRVERLLARLAEIFPRAPCVVAKELTKLHENFLSGSAAELLEILARDATLTRGEFVVLIDNSGLDERPADGAEERELLAALLAELPVKTAVKIAMRLTNGSKNEIYQQALKIQEEKKSGLAK